MDSGSGPRAEDSDGDPDRPRWNVPNLLSGIRAAASPLLLPIAYFQWQAVFLGLFLVLLVTDWLDGKLAVAWRQRTAFGARLDSVADALMYGGLLLGGCLLLPDFIWTNRLWIALAVGSFVLTATVGWLKFGRFPSYHSWGAKTSWLLTSVGAVSVLLDGPSWPFQVAMAAVSWTNFEATLITLRLPCWKSDVPTLYHAWKMDLASDSQASQDRRAGHAQDRRGGGQHRRD